ncbi:MAG: hypothetical protein NTX03_01340 [Bacteroidetes bacterium]|nr:hypothetical protein [Bacteroidota bacterium]
MFKTLYLFSSLLFASTTLVAQGTLTAEDSLNKNTQSTPSHTTIGGYGNVLYQNDFNAQTSEINLERMVLFFGHKFSNRIGFFSELELEDAKVAGGSVGGELALEQCYLKFNFNPTNYLVAGLFLPRIGILNENHLPNTFNGNERTRVETLVIPSTWRELGIGYYGSMNSFPISYNIGLVNGLNSSAFEHGSGIREGRFEGRTATANNLAITGALQFLKGDFKAQISGYYGGTVGLAPREADSLKLTSGFFGTPVMLWEADAQYVAKGFTVKLLAAMLSIPDAKDINRAYANNTATSAYGGYAEVGYNILQTYEKYKTQQLIVFGRYEKLDLNASLPANGITDGTLNQTHIVAGFSYLPLKNVVIKADVRFMQTGKQNPDLIINLNPIALPYQQNNTLLNLGIGYAF